MSQAIRMASRRLITGRAGEVLVLALAVLVVVVLLLSLSLLLILLLLFPGAPSRRVGRTALAWLGVKRHFFSRRAQDSIDGGTAFCSAGSSRDCITANLRVPGRCCVKQAAMPATPVWALLAVWAVEMQPPGQGPGRARASGE